jgi:ATP-dependent DNA helicase Rep
MSGTDMVWLPRRERGLTWTTETLQAKDLRKQCYHVVHFAHLRPDILAAQLAGSKRDSLDNPAKQILAIFRDHPKVAILGVPTKEVGDLQLIYGYLVEPAFRADCDLLISADRDLTHLKPEDFVDHRWRYPWTLERLHHLTDLARPRRIFGQLPPMTPIEALMFRALRDLGLAPLAQYGVGPYRADLAFPQQRLLVECDGRDWHDAERDRRRDAHLDSRGWSVVRFSGSRITRESNACAAEVSSLLSDRAGIVSYSELVGAVGPTSLWARLLSLLKRLLRRGGSADEWGPPPDLPEPQSEPSALDPFQLAAVRARDGCVQVIAPAGSGKTRVLVERVRQLTSRGVPPNRILCATFSKDATVEVGQRLSGVGISGACIRSFHGLGWMILNDHSLLRSRIDRLTLSQWKWLAKEAMDAAGDAVWIEPGAAQELISNFKLAKMVSPDVAQMLAGPNSPEQKTAARLYERYEKVLEEQDMLDFDDLIARSVHLLQNDAEARRKWQERFQHVLVDEYQDIEPAQALLIGIVAGPEDNLFCVGDEDQCIYAWRRANVESVIELDLAYPGLERFPLTKNYRCGSAITEASRTLVEHNRRRFRKPIESGRTEPGSITSRPIDDLDAAGALLATELRQQVRGEVVVLARTSTLLRAAALACAEQGIRIDAPKDIYALTGPGRTLQAYLRLFADLGNALTEDVDRVFRVPNRYLPRNGAEQVAAGLRSGMTFAQALQGVSAEAWRRTQLEGGAALLDSLSQESEAPALIHRLRTEGGLDTHYASQEQLSVTEHTDIETLDQELKRASKQSTRQFAAELAAGDRLLRSAIGEDGIEFSTIHRAKGKEWKHVVLYGADAGQLPHARTLDEELTKTADALEDERRLAYVALTRAMDRLTIIYTDGKPSEFLTEAQIVEPPATTDPRGISREPTRTDGPVSAARSQRR